MTSTSFSMRIQIAERQFVDLTVTGQGFKYDEKTGAILTGVVSELTITDSLLLGKKIMPQQIHQISNLKMDAEKIASIFGNHFWNDAKFVVEVADKFSTLHDLVITNHFSKARAQGIGSEGDDHITGSGFADSLLGQAGDDILSGGKGNDRIDGGKGFDRLNGDTGNDYLTDLVGNNTLSGGAGHDRLRAGSGDDILAGGAGNDLIYGAGGRDVLSGGKGTDSFVFNAKDDGWMTIRDFATDDVLVNLLAGSPEEAYKQFMEAAHQDGKTVVYDQGGLHIELQNFNLKALTEKNFSDGAALIEQGFI